MTEQQGKKKVSKLAKVAVWCLVGGIVLGILGGNFSNGIFFFGVALFLSSGPLAIAALVAMKKSKSRSIGKGRSIAVLISWLILTFLLFMPVHPARDLTPRYVCGINTKGLGTALYVYAFDYEDRLPVEEWNDLLMAECDVSPKSYICPATDCVEGEESCYTLNVEAAGKNLEKLPADMVLLFESKPGWNQVGGKELLSLDNHDGEGCNILFADGHAEFIRADKIDQLRWMVGEEVKALVVSEGLFDTAGKNAEQANEGFKRADKYVRGWLALADAETGLIPRNTKDMYWNAQDSAADNYPFMVLTASFTDEALFQGKMKEMLETEIKITSRIDSLPDTFDFKTQKFRTDKPNLNSIMFGSSEYIKDGLLPLTEWLGKSPWSDRMTMILDDMWKHAPVETPFGKIVSDNVEVNGEMLQTLSRLYWMDGNEQYLEFAVRLGDYYLLGDHHPTNNLERLRLRDHGCEIVSGLCELYATVSFAKPDKKKQYQKPIHQMLDRILEVGRKDDGMFYNSVNPITGEVTSKGIADTWGYTYNGYYTVYMVDKTQRYLDETKRVLGNISNYTNYAWEGASSDGYADSIESGISLYNRLPTASVANWIDSETKVMWSKQKPTGVIEGWHGDGNFARTTIMYCLWKTQGMSIHPWREDVRIGAVQNGGKLYISLVAEKPWKGRIKFDQPRHKTIMKLPIDWPRINHFPEWFTVEEGVSYVLLNEANSSENNYTCDQLIQGVDFEAEANVEYELTLTGK